MLSLVPPDELFSFGHGFGSDFWKRWNYAHESHYHLQTWQGFRGSGDEVPPAQWQLSSLNISPKHLQRLPFPQQFPNSVQLDEN